MKINSKHPLANKSSTIITHIVLITWVLIVIFPLFMMIMNSFKNHLDISIHPLNFPKSLDFRAYKNVLENSDFGRYFFNSFIVTVISISMILLVASIAAYALVNWKSKFSGVIYLFFIAGMMLPIKIGSIKIISMIKDLGLLNNIAGLLPIYIAMGIPMAIMVLTQFIKSIPKEINEAAKIDGASPLRVFSSITVHLIRPALGTVAIFNLVPIWNDLWFPLLTINKESQKTLILGVTRLFGQYEKDWGSILAVLTMSAIPIIILYLIMAKQFIKGMTAGAVKG